MLTNNDKAGKQRMSRSVPRFSNNRKTSGDSTATEEEKRERRKHRFSVGRDLSRETRPRITSQS